VPGPADPAVSFMLLLRGKISGAKAIAYMAAQVAGAVLGAFICTILIPGVQAGAGLGAPGKAPCHLGVQSTCEREWHEGRGVKCTDHRKRASKRVREGEGGQQRTCQRGEAQDAQAAEAVLRAFICTIIVPSVRGGLGSSSRIAKAPLHQILNGGPCQEPRRGGEMRGGGGGGGTKQF
jgi:hypothetical protein